MKQSKAELHQPNEQPRNAPLAETIRTWLEETLPALWQKTKAGFLLLRQRIATWTKALWDRYRAQSIERQRLIAAGAMGGVAVFLFAIALIVGISSCNGRRAQAAARAMVLSAEAEESEPTALPVSMDELGPTEEWEDNEAVPAPTEKPQSLKKHAESPEVLALQKRLIQLGYLEIDEPTEYFGSATEYAVKLFQRQHELTMDGVAGEQTLALLYSDEAQKYTLKEGAEGRDVKMLQEQLVDLGYLESSQVDYVYGEVTQAAVMAFQKRNKLTADGKAGEKTLALLYSDDAKVSAELAAKQKAEEEAAAKKAKEEEAKAKQDAAKAKQAQKTAETKSAKEKKIEKFIKAAQSKLGCEYVLGDRGPNTFDCSGFVWYCLKQAGVSTTRLNAAGFSRKSGWKEIKSYSQVQKGDILFFRSDDSSSVSHTGIYVGGGMMIDASSGNGKVVKRAVSAYWKRNFVNARRPW